MEKQHYINLGIALKDARIKKGLTQGEVARLLGYSSAQFVSNAERGLCRLPFEAISRLVRLYEMDAEVVISGFLRTHEAHYREVFKMNLRQQRTARMGKPRTLKG